LLQHRSSLTHAAAGPLKEFRLKCLLVALIALLRTETAMLQASYSSWNVFNLTAELLYCSLVDNVPKCRNTARAAYAAVELPDAVIDILTSLRDYLQDKCEPPVYVSDRRFMKSVNLLQVAAHADGRDQVHIFLTLMPMPLWQKSPQPKSPCRYYIIIQALPAHARGQYEGPPGISAALKSIAC